MTNSDELPFPSMFTEPLILNSDCEANPDVPIDTQAQLLEETKANAERLASERSREMAMTNSDELPFPSMFKEPIVLNSDYTGCRDPDVPIDTQAQLLEETKANAERRSAANKLLCEAWTYMVQNQTTPLPFCSDCFLVSALLDQVTCPICEAPLQNMLE